MHAVLHILASATSLAHAAAKTWMAKFPFVTGFLVANSARRGEPIARLVPFAVQDILLMAGLMVSFSLFLGVKKETRTQARRYQEALREIEGLLPKLRAAAQLPEAERRGENTYIHPDGPPRSGFNLQRRAQAIRLLRRGEGVAHISAALGVPRVEVELLIRVQQLAASRSVKMS